MASQWNMCLCAVHTRVFNHYYYLHHWLKFAQVAGGILLNTQLAVHHLNFRQNRWALLWNFDWRERRKLCRNLFGSLNSNVMTYHRFEFQLIFCSPCDVGVWMVAWLQVVIAYCRYVLNWRHIADVDVRQRTGVNGAYRERHLSRRAQKV